MLFLRTLLTIFLVAGSCEPSQPAAEPKINWREQHNWGAIYQAIYTEPKAVPQDFLTEFPELSAYKQYGTRGDGSCWLWALLRAAFNTVLNDDASFINFIDRMAAVDDNNVREAIEILKIFKEKNETDRIHMWNHVHVKDVLDLAFRKIIIIQAQKDGDEKLAADTAKPCSWGHHHHFSAFSKYFDIEIHALSKYRADKDTTIYQYQVSKGNIGLHPKVIENKAATRVLIIISTNHYENLIRLQP